LLFSFQLTGLIIDESCFPFQGGGEHYFGLVVRLQCTPRVGWV
jgi:hypothetical protein